MTTPQEPRGRRPARIAAGAIVAVALLGGGAIAVSAATRTSAASATTAGYRTALVSEQSVRQTLDNVGVIEPVAQASVAFPATGTVASVGVKVGDTVTVGQQLAHLSTTSLEATLTQDQASLAAAKLTLHQALNGETITAGGSGGGGGAATGGGAPTGTGTTRTASASTGAKIATASLRSTSTSTGIVDAAIRPSGPTSTVPTSSRPTSSGPTSSGPATTGSDASAAPTTTTPSGGGGSGGPSTRPSGTSTGTGTGGGSTHDPALAAAQQAVLDGQQRVDADLATASRDLATANQVCRAAGTTSTDGPTTTTPATTDPTTTTLPSDSTGSAAGASANATTACTAALQQVLTDQQTVARDQADLATASTKLDDLITASGTTSSTGGNGGPSSSSGNSNGNGNPTGGGATTGRLPSSTGATSAPTGTTTTSSPSAEQLVAYQAAVDTATLQVEVANQAIAQATIVTPIAGQVVDVNLTPGSKVSAGSSTANIVIVGQGGYEVTTTVSVDNVSKVKVGQAAQVTPDGEDTTITGKVVSISVAADSTGSTTTYTVVVGFTGRPGGLRNGSTADVHIVTATSAKTLAVPSSAVSAVGTGHRVTVVSKGKASEVQVEVGAIGSDYTAITSGLSAGQAVALADLSEPLPSQATSSTNGSTNRTGNRTTTGFGGPGGGNFPPGGFGGQRPGG